MGVCERQRPLRIGRRYIRARSLQLRALVSKASDRYLTYRQQGNWRHAFEVTYSTISTHLEKNRPRQLLRQSCLRNYQDQAAHCLFRPGNPPSFAGLRRCQINTAVTIRCMAAVVRKFRCHLPRRVPVGTSGVTQVNWGCSSSDAFVTQVQRSWQQLQISAETARRDTAGCDERGSVES